jgi:2-polyprenyl-3-methyl-5-hydroxy-6-metoxy-1,4-benzoquinol methylase
LTSGRRRIGFLPETGRRPPAGYLRRLGRLRWARRFPSNTVADLAGDRPASGTFAEGDEWIVVRDETALPLPGGEIVPPAGRVVFAAPRSPATPPIVHTLAELEWARFSADGDPDAEPATPPAVGFAVSDFPPAARETVQSYVERLVSTAGRPVVPCGFEAVVFDDESAERPEIACRLPRGVRRLLDVGCGSGSVSAAVRRDSPGVEITGIERESSAAERARERIDRVIAGDAVQALAGLLREGARFDGFLFADVLEHLEDPVGSLTLARKIADPGATLVASVPNVGHLSLVRDLVRGRFDPLPAGLADAGHLRWFTRSSLADALEEAGWKTTSVDGVAGAPSPDAPAFLVRALDFPEADPASLGTYQWVATARAE